MATKALTSFWSGDRGDNFTTATDQGRNDAAAAGYVQIREEGQCLDTQEPGTVPLKLFWNEQRGDNFVTATAQGEADARVAWYKYIRDEGFVYTEQQAGTVPLKLFWSPEREDNFTTATPEGEADAQAAGYSFIRVEGYVHPAQTTSAPVVKFPLHVSKSWQQSAMHMHAQLILTQQGQLNGIVQTWSTWWLRGFTGGCVIVVSDAHGNILWSTVKQYGVDGTAIGILGKNSSRLDFVVEELPDDVVSKAYRLDVMLSHMPKNRLEAIVQEIKDGLKTLKDGADEIAKYIGV